MHASSKKSFICSWRSARSEGGSLLSPRDRILAVIRVKRIYRVNDLGEIVFCLRAFRLVLHSAEGGKEQTDQNGNDRNHYEQFDKSEGILLATLRSRWLILIRFKNLTLVAGRLKQLKRLKKSKRSIFSNLVTF